MVNDWCDSHLIYNLPFMPRSHAQACQRGALARDGVFSFPRSGVGTSLPTLRVGMGGHGPIFHGSGVIVMVGVGVAVEVGVMLGVGVLVAVGVGE